MLLVGHYFDFSPAHSVARVLVHFLESSKVPFSLFIPPPSEGGDLSHTEIKISFSELREKKNKLGSLETTIAVS